MINKLLVMYIDVGQLPLVKALALADKFECKYSDLLERLKQQGVENMVIPVRGGPTRIETCEIAKNRIEQLEELKLQLMAQNPQLVA